MPYEGAWRTGVAQGREDERERIIKLLENSTEENITMQEDNYWSGYQAAITLIKGENK